jgi:hypothetical protein
MAVDNAWQYRPQESPANAHINDDAVDAGGILRRYMRPSLSSFAASSPARALQSHLARRFS